MERHYKAVLSAIVAIALLSTSARAQPSRGDPEPAVAEAAYSEFVRQLDRAMEEVDATALEKLAAQSKPGIEADLAKGAALFITGDYAAALEKLEGWESIEAEELRRRAQELNALVSAWQSVFSRLVPVENDGISIFVPKSQTQWGKLLPLMIAGWHANYARYFLVPELPAPPVVFVPDQAALAALARVPLDAVKKTGTTGTHVLGRIVLLSPSAFPNGYDWSRVLCHEMVHTLLDARVRGKLPHFLDEGIATYLEEWGLHGRPKRLSTSQVALLFMATNDGLFLEREALGQPYWQMADALGPRIAFLQTLFWVRVLVQRGGTDAIPQLVKAVAEGQPWSEAVQTLTGISVNAMFAWAKGRWTNVGDRDGLDALLYQQFPERLDSRDRKRLEQSRKDVLMGDLLWGRGRPKAALEMYTQATEALQHTPDLAWRLVRLLLEMQRPEQAEKLAERAVQLFPDDARVLYLNALLRKNKGEKVEAARLARRAWLVNPFAIETINLFEELKVHLLDAPPEE